MAFKFVACLLMAVQILGIRFTFDKTIPQHGIDDMLMRNCSQFKRIPCPSPIRPSNVLNSVDSNRTVWMRFTLPIRSCVTEHGAEDLFFSLHTFTRTSDFPEIIAFDVYNVYRRCPIDCEAYIMYDPIKGIEESVDRIEPDHIYLECDHRLSNCSVFSWNCSKWTEEKDGPDFLAMIDDMLPPSVELKSPERVPPLVFGLASVVGVIVVIVCVLFIKKV